MSHNTRWTDVLVLHAKNGLWPRHRLSNLEDTEILGGFSKRAIDIILSLAALTVLMPTFLVLALVIKLCDRGNVFYAHQRIGHDGKQFGCLKFRSMRSDADEYLHEYLAQNEAAKDEWERTHKLRNDPRITLVGRMLRRSSLDELPQLINVLRGDMSLVGPRPVTNAELHRYGEQRSAYLAGRPGLTGKWQVSGRSDVDYDQRVALDVAYVTNWSLLADFTIMVRTVPALFSQRGSY